MQLLPYLEAINMDAKEFAKQIGVHPNTIYALCKYKHEPLITLAFKIEKATRGKVTAKELAQTWESMKHEI